MKGVSIGGIVTLAVVIALALILANWISARIKV